MRHARVATWVTLAAICALAWVTPPAHAASGTWELLGRYRQIQLRRFTSDLTGAQRCWIQADFSGLMLDGPEHRFRLSIGFSGTDFEFNVEVLSDAGWLKLDGHLLRTNGGSEFALTRLLGRPNTHLLPAADDADRIVRELLENDDFYLRYQATGTQYEAVGEFAGLTVVMAHALENCEDSRLMRMKYIEAGGWVPKTP
ncbi:MAG: hypothetical protein QNJ92_10510 [Alphaproteobacteria bacterium]|nr:hypothetical protein [Alphaproteobacteria bacterium]